MTVNCHAYCIKTEREGIVLAEETGQDSSVDSVRSKNLEVMGSIPGRDIPKSLKWY